MKRIEEVHEEAITGTEDVKQYVEHVKKFLFQKLGIAQYEIFRLAIGS
jgi:hypothetical protein